MGHLIKNADGHLRKDAGGHLVRTPVPDFMCPNWPRDLMIEGYADGDIPPCETCHSVSHHPWDGKLSMRCGPGQYYCNNWTATGCYGDPKSIDGRNFVNANLRLLYGQYWWFYVQCGICGSYFQRIWYGRKHVGNSPEGEYLRVDTECDCTPAGTPSSLVIVAA
jgi:hypothetical protein